LLIVVLGVGAFFYFGVGERTDNAADNDTIDSIAVLPFENAASNPNAEYLSDGITVSLINGLSQISHLKVMSLGSVLRYKGVEHDPQTVGSELNVRGILTGSVRQVGEQVVVNVSLDDSRGGRHIWGEQYVREFGDILAIQDEIEQKVLANLKVHLSGPEERHLAKRYTNDPEAYQLYLKGQYEWRKHTQEGIMTGIDYFKQALEKDPSYALAYAGLSASYGVLGNSYVAPSEAFSEARSYAAKALEIDDTLPESHVAMAAIKLYFDWDVKAAASELDRAQALDPNNAESYNIRGDLLDAISQFDLSLTSRKRAVDLDPQSAMYNCNLGVTLLNAGQYDEALAYLDRTTDLEPRYVDAWTYLAQAYEQKKMFQQAIDALEKGAAKAERHPQLIALLARDYAKTGDSARSKQALAELEEMSKQQYVSPYLFAIAYDGLGDHENTFGALENALKQRSYFLIWLGVDPEFSDLHGDQRFRDLVERVDVSPVPR
jgi:TolB-like protein/Tfp pilus assembly protein PilF